MGIRRRRRMNNIQLSTEGLTSVQTPPQQPTSGKPSTTAAIITGLTVTAVGVTGAVYLASKPTTETPPSDLVAEARAKQPIEGQVNRKFKLDNCDKVMMTDTDHELKLVMTSNDGDPDFDINDQSNYEFTIKDGFVDIKGDPNPFRVVYYTNDENDYIVKVDPTTGLATGLQKGKTKVTAKIYNDNAVYEATCKVKVPTQNVVEYYFVNTNNSAIMAANNDMAAHSEAIIMKTIGEKYVLLDVGSKKEWGIETIIRYLKDLQKTDKPVIDYLIISHLHSDHMGGLSILLKKNVQINHVIYKDEVNTTKDEGITGGFENTEVDLTEDEDEEVTMDLEEEMLTGRLRIAENDELYIDKYLTLKFFNTSDVWAGKKCKADDGGKLKYTKLTLRSGSDRKYKQFEVEGLGKKYIYIDGREFAQGIYTYHYSDTLEFDPPKDNEPKLMARFYVGAEAKNPCGENAQSYAVLAISNSGKDSAGKDRLKYAYFPSDIQNVGMTVLPDENYEFGDTTELWFEGDPVFTVDSEKGGTAVKLTDKNITKDQASYKAAYESRAAEKVSATIKSKGGSLAIYQVAHHAYNNSLDSLSKLGIVNMDSEGKPELISNEDIYSIYTMKIPVSHSKNFSQARSWYYLSKTTRMNVGGKSNNETTHAGRADGVLCYINNNNGHACKYTILDASTGYNTIVIDARPSDNKTKEAALDNTAENNTIDVEPPDNDDSVDE